MINEAIIRLHQVETVQRLLNPEICTDCFERLTKVSMILLSHRLRIVACKSDI